MTATAIISSAGHSAVAANWSCCCYCKGRCRTWTVCSRPLYCYCCCGWKSSGASETVRGSSNVVVMKSSRGARLYRCCFC